MDESTDIERAVRELTKHPEEVLADSSSTGRLNHFLEILVSRNGSDLLLVAGTAASVRVDGEMEAVDSAILTGPEIESIVLPALSNHALKLYREGNIADSSYRVGKLGRFRINLHRERGKAAAAIRALPNNVPALRDLNLPPSVEMLAHLQRGLVLIGGPAGTGKSTTLAALVH
jgi:twitching motility protein PilT